MFISVTFRILGFRTLPFIPQKKSALNFPQIAPFRSSTADACLLWQLMGTVRAFH